MMHTHITKSLEVNLVVCTVKDSAWCFTLYTSMEAARKGILVVLATTASHHTDWMAFSAEQK